MLNTETARTTSKQATYYLGLRKLIGVDDFTMNKRHKFCNDRHRRTHASSKRRQICKRAIFGSDVSVFQTIQVLKTIASIACVEIHASDFLHCGTSTTPIHSKYGLRLL